MIIHIQNLNNLKKVKYYVKYSIREFLIKIINPFKKGFIILQFFIISFLINITQRKALYFSTYFPRILL